MVIADNGRADGVEGLVVESVMEGKRMKTAWALVLMVAMRAAMGLEPEPVTLSPTEMAQVSAEIMAADDEGKASIIQYYEELGVDVGPLRMLAASASPMDPAAMAAGGMPKPTSIQQALQAMDFMRTPQAVLAARSELGFGASPKPAITAFEDAAKWLRLQVMAGEWSTFAAYLKEMPEPESQAVYSHVLRSLGGGGGGGEGMPPGMRMPRMARGPRGEGGGEQESGLLPEEVLAIGDAAPAALSDWQIDVLVRMLKSAASKFSIDPMLQMIDAGTPQFGRKDQASRGRTIRFLVGADLIKEAYAYFPPLDEARKNGDAAQIMNHARYHGVLAVDPRTGEAATEHLRTAWRLYADVTLIPDAPAPIRQDALRQAIDRLPKMPPKEGSAWVKEVFTRAELGPAALEVIALKAVSLGDPNVQIEDRAQTILTMKESVDTLLAQEGIDIAQMRVPLRMLTTALVAEAETTLAGGDQQNRQNRNMYGYGPYGPFGNVGQNSVSRDLELLLRALPSERWLNVLEPSLATRAYRAAVGVALGAGETDLALDYLASGVKRFPASGVQFADDFLLQWESRLKPSNDGPNYKDYYFFFGRRGVAAAPLTRGRQRRDLGRLTRLMDLLDKAGVESRQLPSVARVFRACHGMTEVFTRDGIQSVFGSIENLSPDTAASLADQMRAGLSGEWRDRKAQQDAGNRRSPAEITAMVEKGYELAIELIERGIAARPDSWRFAITKAALAYDRLQYKQSEQKQDFAAYNQYRKEAFQAFAQTAERYGEQVRLGREREDPGVFLAWFNAAVGSTELNYLTRDDLLVEGSPQDDQIDLIRKAMLALPDEAADKHIGAFARAMSDAAPKLAPEVKPRVVRHAMRIVRDHPAGSPLRRLADLYQDLVKDEIKFRIVVDGSDRVGDSKDKGSRFGALLTLRFTTQVDRETGGFSRYLQNDVWTRVGNQYRPVNNRDLFNKSIEASLNEHFVVDSIGFFEPLTPPRPVKEEGEDGWLEKPMAYVVMTAKDASADRIPQLTLDMQFDDAVGPVTLPLMSNSPPIDASTSGGDRPVRNLEVSQALDLRGMDNSEKGRPVTLEIHAKGQGVIPDLEELLPGFRDALKGYAVSEKGIEVRPINVVQEDGDWGQMYWGRPKDDEKDKGYIEPDESGMYRLTTERSWMITYTPTGSGVGGAFTLPALAKGLDGKLLSRQYADMDLVTVTTPTVPVAAPIFSIRNLLLLAGAIIAAAVGAVVLVRRGMGGVQEAESSQMPSRITPLSVITTLRRIQEADATDSVRQQSLTGEIARLEKLYFGPASSARPEGPASEIELKQVLQQWARR
jgi:hypothetical protein